MTKVLWKTLIFTAIEVNCEPLSLPPGTHIEKLNTGAVIVHCDRTYDSWNMRCVNGDWLQYPPDPTNTEKMLGFSPSLPQTQYGQCREGNMMMQTKCTNLHSFNIFPV